jgi:hypothetical protein
VTRARRGTAGWIVAGVLATAALAWMMLRPRPLEGGWKAIDVYAGVEPTEAAAARLNERLDRLTAWRELRNSERFRFRSWDGRVVGDAKVMGDDWDLAVYLRALAAISLEEPTVRFELVSEPEGERLALTGGRFGRRDRAVRRFLDELAGPRPNLEGQFSSLRLETAGDPPALRAALEHQLAGATWPHLQLPLDYAAIPSGTAITARSDGDVRTLVRLLDALQSAIAEAGATRAAGRPCRVILDGKQHRERPLADFEDWFRLRDELAVAEGPLDPSAP